MERLEIALTSRSCLAKVIISENFQSSCLDFVSKLGLVASLRELWFKCTYNFKMSRDHSSFKFRLASLASQLHLIRLFL